MPLLQRDRAPVVGCDPAVNVRRSCVAAVVLMGILNLTRALKGDRLTGLDVETHRNLFGLLPIHITHLLSTR